MLEFETRLKRILHFKYGIWLAGLIITVGFSAVLVAIILPLLESPIPQEGPEMGNIPQSQLVSEVFLFLVSIGIGMSVVFALSSLIATQQRDAVITDIFELYHFKKIKQFVAQVDISSQTTLLITWNKKNGFLIMHNQTIIARATSAELFWKIIYWGHNLYKIR